MQIEFNDVKYYYNYKNPNESHALNGVSFAIEKGDFIAVVGKTGSGKSTLVQTLNALILPTFGYTKVDDYIITSEKKLKKSLLVKSSKEIKKLNKKMSLLKKNVGLVFQFPEYQLFSENILKDVSFGPKNYGLSNDEAVEAAKKALKKVGIKESYYDKSPFEISGGEKRRVGIAGIIASNPEIIVLDEPTVGLDGNGKTEIMTLFKKLNEEGKTIIIVTHNMDVVKDYAKKVIVLNEGKIVKATTPTELFNEENLGEYSLEEPTFYKFKRILKEKGFTGDLDKINDEKELIKTLIKEMK